MLHKSDCAIHNSFNGPCNCDARPDFTPEVFEALFLALGKIARGYYLTPNQSRVALSKAMSISIARDAMTELGINWSNCTTWDKK